MGKDHEFLEAARSGNITLVEKILNQKAKRSGPLASLRRGPGSNVQDSSGYSALHHATLNGHIDVVKLLLSHDASPNLPDARGASPLHLAAWAGHQDIVKLFLTHPHRPANPNLQTVDNETPLHFAAQHGHTGALTTLLAHGADPNVTNNRNETPLDLAAQYGRLQAVQMLIRAHPELLEPFKVDVSNADRTRGCPHRVMVSHSPLHLASRNGHKNVVAVLLAAGVNVNLLTPSGTALHEAALCGKDTVVRTLLEFGADMDATDSENRTALDILEEFPPHVTKGIISVINSHRNSNLYDSESDDIVKDCSNNKHHSVQQQPQSHQRHRHYQPQHQKHQVSSNKNNLGSSYENSCSSPVHNYYSSSHHEMTSPSSSMGSLGPPSPRQRASSGDLSEFYVPMEAKKKLKSTAPKKPPRRNLSVSPTHLNGSNVGCQRGRDGYMSMSVDGYTPMGNRSGGSGSDSSAKLPTTTTQQGPLNYEYIFLAHTGNKKDIEIRQRLDGDCDYVQMMPRPEPRTTLSHSYENTTLKSYNPNRKLRRNRDNYELFGVDLGKSQDNDKDRCLYRSSTDASNLMRSSSPTATNNSSSSTTTPQSPTNYQQPPTPEHPPPSATLAEKFIHERIRPLNQEYKRRSGILQQTLLMTESGTSPAEPLCPSLCASSGSLSSSISISDRSVSTDCVEEFIGDIPFAGLFKGSTMTLNNTNLNYPPQYRCQQKYDYIDGSVGYQQSVERSKMFPNQHQYNDYRIEYQQNRSLSFGGIITSSADREDETMGTVWGQEDSQNSHEDANLQRPQTFFHDHSRSVDDFYQDYERDQVQQRGAVKNTLPDRVDHDIFSPFDEEEAWAKISEIMESFGSEILKSEQKDDEDWTDIVAKQNQENDDHAGAGKFSNSGVEKCERNNLNIAHMKNSCRSFKYSSLGQFLQEYHLQHIENILVDSGFDHIEHLNGTLNENDLKAMNISMQPDGQKLLDAIKQLPQTQPRPLLQHQQQEPQMNNNNSILNIDQWLHDIHLPEYADIFKRHLCKTLEGGCRVWEVELQTVLEINKIGHRKRILYSISNIRKSQQLGSTTVQTLGSSIINSEDDFKSGSIVTTANVASIKHNNKKNRPAPKPPIRANSLEIRAPSELLLGLPSNLRTQWRHPASVLITSSVTYDVYYLGSTVVKELRGTESTRKSIQKLKRDNRTCNENSTPSIVGADFQISSNYLDQPHRQQQRKQLVRLSISHRGVEFINTESHNTICEHEIRNINCACQAADDLSHFAYITKDADINIHYCHVFNADSMDLATEIILTLGQAFEVAYQLALREASPKNIIRTSMFEVIQ